jgi:LysR family transcriptional regulator of abg operon
VIDPRTLRTFHAVCRAGTISGAARALNISQPSVTAAIQSLEASLGVELFTRSRGGIILSPAGEALSRSAEMQASLLAKAEEDVEAAKAGLFGALSVGGTPGALVSLLPRALTALDGMDLQFSLSVIERSDRDLVRMLRQGEIELAFVTTELEEPADDIAEQTLSRDPFALIVGRRHDDLPDRLKLAAATGLPWVLPEARGAFRRQVDALFIDAGLLVPRNVIRCDSLLTTKALVRQGKRVTILPVEVAAAELSIGVLRAITLEDTRLGRSVGVRWIKDRPISPFAERLLKVLQR